MNSKTVIAFTLLTTLIVAGCGRQDPAPTKARAPVAAKGEKGEASAAKTDVVKIVFVGQKEACDCTHTRIEGSWKALQEALGEGTRVGVERIQLDVDEAQAEKLSELRPIMVAPGIYFFDGNEQLLEMIQGEVTAAQISAVL